MKKNNIKLLHSHSYHADVVARVSGALAGVPVLNTMHTNSSWKRKPVNPMHHFMRWFDSFTARKWATGFIALTDSIKEYHTKDRGYPSKFWKTIPNPIDVGRLQASAAEKEATRAELGIAADETLIIAIGNLLKIKGHKYLVEALSMLESNGRLKVCICGEGAERQHLNDLINERGLSDNVKLLGYREKVGELLAAADIFAMPSLSEGQSLAILEAMCARMPLIVTSQGGHCDFLKNGKNALVVTPGSAHELSEAIALMIEGDGLQEKLASNAEQTYLGMSVGKSVELQESFYLELLEMSK